MTTSVRSPLALLLHCAAFRSMGGRKYQLLAGERSRKMATNKYADVSLGTVEAVFNKLGGVDGIKRFLAGNVDVVIKDHVINCGVDPYKPDGWNVESHQDQGEMKLTRDGDNLYLDGKKIEFFLSPNQAEGKSIKGDNLRKELEGKPVLNACVLDYLREHPELIPESWKVDEKGRPRYIFFWGTIYRNSDGDLCVRCLCWFGDGWHWDYDWLDVGWLVDRPAAVLAS